MYIAFNHIYLKANKDYYYYYYLGIRCGRLPVILNSALIGDVFDYYGVLIRYSCLPGYRLDTGGYFGNLTCLSDTSWNWTSICKGIPKTRGILHECQLNNDIQNTCQIKCILCSMNFYEQIYRVCHQNPKPS